MLDIPRGIELTTRIRARPEDVFPYLVDPSLYIRWQGVRAELQPEPGGRYRVEILPGRVVSGHFVELEPPRRVVFTWGWEGDALVPPGSSTVEVTLEPDAGETLVRLRHTGLPNAAAIEEHSLGWNHYVARLTAAAGGTDPGPDPQISR